MAARRPARRGTAAPKSALTPHQALAYGICAAFYGSGGCSCEKQGTGNVCANVTTAAVKARAIIEAENPK